MNACNLLNLLLLCRTSLSFSEQFPYSIHLQAGNCIGLPADTSTTLKHTANSESACYLVMVDTVIEVIASMDGEVRYLFSDDFVKTASALSTI